ncbi:Very-long-chain enoyl-CoA reductase [Diatrype stigma]|uniref:Very-long-chain enoyl-CoA reductase n=1 Tax=Diatrype stigma TaxID=117547 RepID=A0AAN9VAA2_9PEZI
MASLSLKKPIKGLPTEIDLPQDANVEYVKKQLAKAARISDFNRIGIFDPVSKKTLKDKNSLIREQVEVIKHGEFLVKDLGPQIAWRTVYMVEYLGPLLFHPLFLGLRHYVYPPLYQLLQGRVPEPNAGGALSATQKLAFGMIVAHFVKREVETVLVHKFSANTMPAAYIFRNSFFYWVFAGLLGGLELYAPFSPAAKADNPLINYAGLALYLFGELANADVHYYLATLRKPGETARKIPRGHGFGLVTCPNYMFEILAWVGIILVTRSPALAFFISIGTYFMWTWAWGKEKAYRKQFGDKYKKKRFVILPGLL